MKIKVLHVITGLYPGGAETFLARLIASMPDCEHSVVSLQAKGSVSLGDYIASIAHSVTYLNMTKSPISICRGIWGLRSLIKNHDGVVHCWMYHANLVGLIASLGTNKSAIIAIRNGALYAENPTKLGWINKLDLIVRAGGLLSCFSKKIITCSQVAADLHKRWGYPTNLFTVIPNGIDTQKFYPDLVQRQNIRTNWNIDKDTFVVGWVGRWHPQKDIPTLLESFSLFYKNNPNALLVLAGDRINSENVELINLISHFGLLRLVRLIGRQEDTYKIYPGFDAYVSSSSFGEAFPNVIIEAMSCGVPVVTTDVGDSKYIVGNYGYIVNIKDASAIAEALHTVKLGLPSTSADLHQYICERYSMPFSVSAYRDIYSSIN